MPAQSPDGKNSQRRATPRFASFKPDTPSGVQSQTTQASEKIRWLPKELGDAQDESRPRSYEQTLGQHHHREYRKTSPKRGPDSGILLDSSKQYTKSRNSLSKLFIVDGKGDVNNLKFGTLYATASYFRYGAGNVVGLPNDQRIDRAVSTDKGLVLSKDTCGLPTNRDRHARWNLDQQGVRELKIMPGKKYDLIFDSAPEAADYVSLKPTQQAKGRRGADALLMTVASSSDEDDTHYRSEEGKANFKKEPADQDLKYSSDTSSSLNIAGSRLLVSDGLAQRKHLQLSRRIDEEPTNFEAWIDLIAHQDIMLGLGQGSASTSPTNAERRSVAEIKLAMFEKALEQIKDTQGRESLLLGMMQEAARIWGKDTISSRWKRILEQNSQSLRLWTKYLDLMQTTFTYFRFGEVRSAYLDCLNIVHQARGSGDISPEERNNIFEIQIYIVLRMTLFMRESGFAEHAIAAWQALLEFVFFRPGIVQSGDHKKDRLSGDANLSMFERFWDSEVPRIGEEGAEGWASFLQKQGRPPQPKVETANDLNHSQDYWKSWLASERRQSLLSRNPARTTDDIGVNDPYRIILFSDIRPFLIDPLSPAGQQLVLDAFLAFCYLPTFPAEGPVSCSRLWRKNCFLRNDALRLSSKLQELWKVRSPPKHGRSEEKDSIDMENPFSSPVREYQVSSDTLFAGKHWFSVFDTWQEQCCVDGGPVEAAWVLRSLKSLIHICMEEEAVALYVLALELRISPETVKKTAKNILRKRPFNIRLYNAYALIEYRLADINKGEAIITKSIQMCKELDEVSQRDTMQLWRTWIWETLSANSAQDALVRLLAIADEEIHMHFPKPHQLDYLDSIEPALLLRTTRALVDTRDHMLSLSSYSHATFAMECLMLFAYLRSGQSLSAATSAFKSDIALLSTHSSSISSNHEYLHQAFARLLYYHVTHTHMFKPSDIRSLLAETIAQFPHNTIFLSLYAWNEARFRIEDRLRSVVKDLVLSDNGRSTNKTPDSVVPHFYAIYSELHRAVTFGSNVSTIRSTFERAVESDSGAHCAGLWKLYFLFEHSRYEVERAKAVYWRSLRACPWAKDLYMLAFEYLRSEKAMGEAGLRGIYELLVEKELRVHVRLEDLFGGLNK